MEDRAGIGGWYLSFTHNQGLGDRRVMVGREREGNEEVAATMMAAAAVLGDFD